MVKLRLVPLREKKTISVIPRRQQKLVTETSMLEEMPLDPLVDQLVLERLQAGMLKYGTSWCEVNLKQDLLEEMYDILNYARMILTRYKIVSGTEGAISEYSDDFVGAKMSAVLTGLVDTITNYILSTQRYVPDFDGPTSNEWVKAHAD